MTESKKRPIIKKVIALPIIIAAAWLLGQWAVPAIMKALFL